MSFAKRVVFRSVGSVGLVVAIALVVVACGSSSTITAASPLASSASSVASGSGSAAAQIKADWEMFFAGTTPAARKMQLLQNGRHFAATIQAQAGSAIAKETEARVSAVSVTSPTMATVTYSIMLNGQPALAHQTGQAMLIHGVWMVDSRSFTALMGMEGRMSSPAPSATRMMPAASKSSSMQP